MKKIPILCFIVFFTCLFGNIFGHILNSNGSLNIIDCMNNLPEMQSCYLYDTSSDNFLEICINIEFESEFDNSGNLSKKYNSIYISHFGFNHSCLKSNIIKGEPKFHIFELSSFYPELSTLEHKISETEILHKSENDGKQSSFTAQAISEYIYNRTNKSINSFSQTSINHCCTNVCGGFVVWDGKLFNCKKDINV
ncbi:MAG: hypothetical protein HN704_06655 [Bacteroidetes bacterium]|jgi:hypothetical protein|nr:hypothetical protein [Bacteroidota bacterium]MBT7491267.1 hypothetical protein [Bacteroidota bacterium]